MLVVAYATGRASHTRQVKGDDPDKKGYPGPPSWGLGVRLTTSPRTKKNCYETSRGGQSPPRAVEPMMMMMMISHKEIYCTFKTCYYTISVLFPIDCHLCHEFTFFSSNNTQFSQTCSKPLSLMSHRVCCHTCYAIQLTHHSHFKTQ